MCKLLPVFIRFFFIFIYSFVALEAACEDFSKRIEREIDAHSVISFDIFDTLILRPYVRPTDLFMHLEKINGCKGFAENRISAEGLARKNTNAEEVTLDEIYKWVPIKFKKFKDIETKLEYDVVRPNPEVQKLYKYALKKKKTLIIVSDMYLPRDVIEKMLRKCGYTGYDKLYLSSDRRKTKNSSHLYLEVLNELKVAPENILHIGDNYFSDCEQAKKVGINTIHYPKLIDRFLKNSDNEKFKKFYERNKELFRSIVVAQLAYKQSQDQNSVMDKSKYWYNIGYQISGPLVFAFCDFVSKQPFLKNYSNVAFIGRDGYIPWKVFQIIRPEIPVKYIYAPRIIGRMCNLNLEKDFLCDQNEIFKVFCSSKLGNQEFKSKKEWLSFFSKNKQKIKEIAEAKKEEYKRYLGLHLKMDQDIAIIDSATASWTAQTLFENIFQNSKVFGCYIWTKPCFDNKHLFTNFMNVEDINSVVNFDIVELLMTAPEPPIVDVVNNEVIHKNPSPEEKIKNEISRYIENGSVDFVRNSQKILKNSGINPTAVFDLINNYSDYPNPNDVKYRSCAVDCSNVAHTQYRPIFYDKVKVTVLSLFSFYSNYGERIIRFWNRFSFITVVTTPKEKAIYLYSMFPILKIQNCNKITTKED